MADETVQRSDYDTEMKYEKNYRTHQTECGVRMQLLKVGWKNVKFL